MATLIPDTFSSGPGSEHQVFLALQRGLPEAWTVWWSVAYSGVMEGRGAESEIDFLCAHPQHGVVIIEVKGGEMLFRDGKWFQNGRLMDTSPVNQVKHNRYTIVRALRAQGRLTYPVAHAVWFPACARVTSEPPELNGITLYAEDLLDPEPRLLAIIKADGHPLYSPVDMAFLRDFLSPIVSYRSTLHQRCTLANNALARLTQEQLHTLDAFEQFQRLRVRGCAGSGKTLLALRRAEQLSRAGKRVLFLCYNVLLGEQLHVLTRHLPGVESGAIFDFLCDLMGKHNPGDDRTFWETLAKEALPEVRRLAEEEPYDAVIIDEGQDFSPDLWDIVRALTPEPCGLLIFYDPAQNVFHRDLTAMPEFPWNEAVLTVNCRNARSVCETLRKYSGVEPYVLADTPAGEKTERYLAPTRAGLRERLRTILTRLLGYEGVAPNEIAILGVFRENRLSLTPVLEEYPGVRYFTYRKFKGLEIPILILFDVDTASPHWDSGAFYTSISRAIHKVIILEREHTDNEPRIIKISIG